MVARSRNLQGIADIRCRGSRAERGRAIVTAGDFEIVRDTARRYEPDRYAAALLAPRARQSDLIALAAFAGDIRRIGQEVRDPFAAELRLQWWRDALKAGAAGNVAGNPVADAFSKVIRDDALALDALDDYLDAHAHTLYQAPPPDEAALQTEIDLKEGTLFRFASQIAAGEKAFNSNENDAIVTATEAYGMMRVALDLPYALARGRVPVPDAMVRHNPDGAPDWQQTIKAVASAARASLAPARVAFRACQRPIRPALSPVALVEPYLKALEEEDRDPARDIAEIAPVTRLWRMLTASWRGRI